MDSIEPIIDAGQLIERLDRVTIVHVGTRGTGTDPVDVFERRHLPGARLVILDDALAGAAGPVVGRHPLPSPESFAAALGEAGVSDDRTVVAYDDRDGGWAARLVWMLRIVGQPAALLDGGLHNWGGEMQSGPADPQPVHRSIVPWPTDRIATADEVVSHLASGGVVIDSREAPRYRGEIEPIDAVAGHVPGAINLPFTDNLVEGRFRRIEEQRSRFASAAMNDAVIVYCGSGVTACHNALAIEAAGQRPPRVFVGSWSGWSTDPGRPIATGPV